ncbi:hypothetical protein [Gottfriedia acidiceleris]|uniref:hypothetical protein n=1 Tax=Gottfriedia acidiceleris TaxID=371036 RepID=UPI0030008FD0
MIKNKMTVSDKRRITSDWNQVIPFLGVYKSMLLMNRLGPLLVGVLLEVKSAKEKYIPIFHVHNLLRPFQVIRLNLNYEISPISIGLHESKFHDTAIKLANQAIIPLLNAYEEYLQKNLGGPYSSIYF